MNVAGSMSLSPRTNLEGVDSLELGHLTFYHAISHVLVISEMSSVPLSTQWSSVWHFSLFIFHFQTKMHLIYEDNECTLTFSQLKA